MATDKTPMRHAQQTKNHLADNPSVAIGHEGSTSPPSHAKPTMSEREKAVLATDDAPLPYDDAPPLPDEAPPQQGEDDGWEFYLDQNTNRYYFLNRFTGVSQWENPRRPGETATGAHGSYDRFDIFFSMVVSF